jgi:hypothetical protein
MAVIEVTNSVTTLHTVEGLSMSVKNLGPAKVWLETIDSVTADLTATGGYPLEPGEAVYFSEPIEVAYSVYGITAGPDDVAYVALTGS